MHFEERSKDDAKFTSNSNAVFQLPSGEPLALGTILSVKTINVKKLIEGRKGYPHQRQVILLGERELNDAEPLCDAKTLRSLPKQDEVTFTVTMLCDESMEPAPATLQKSASLETRENSPIEPDVSHPRKAAKRGSIAQMDAADNKKGCCTIF